MNNIEDLAYSCGAIPDFVVKRLSGCFADNGGEAPGGDTDGSAVGGSDDGSGAEGNQDDTGNGNSDPGTDGGAIGGADDGSDPGGNQDDTGNGSQQSDHANDESSISFSYNYASRGTVTIPSIPGLPIGISGTLTSANPLEIANSEITASVGVHLGVNDIVTGAIVGSTSFQNLEATQNSLGVVVSVGPKPGNALGASLNGVIGVHAVTDIQANQTDVNITIQGNASPFHASTHIGIININLFSFEPTNGFEVEIDSHAPPIVIDLDGDGIELVDIENSTAFFDYNGDGLSSHTGWVSPDDGLLVIDYNSDGLITGPGEVDFTFYSPESNSDLEALHYFDSDGNGILDSNDEEWSKFHIWQDINQNGVAEEN